MRDAYYKPLQEACKEGKPIISPAHIRTIFSDIEIMITLNEGLLKEIEPIINSWGPHKCLGQIFINLTEIMKLYMQYINNYTEALKTYVVLKKKNEKFTTFLKTVICKEKLKTGKMVELDSYLILPIQRIPRYVLLLQELVKHTWKDHADYQKLCEAWDKMQKTANYMNEKKKETENSFKVLEIKSKIDGTFEKDLTVPYRKFVAQIECNTPDKKKLPRTLFMFNDIMLITEPKNSESYKLLGSPILIEKVRGVNVPNCNNFKFLTSMDEVALEIVMYTTEQKKLLEDEFTKQKSDIDSQKKNYG